MVNFLLLVSKARVTPPLPANSRVSELLPAEKELLPDLMVLKIFWLLPRSELVSLSPSRVIPVPASRLKMPVEPWRERTPVFAIVGV